MTLESRDRWVRAAEGWEKQADRFGKASMPVSAAMVEAIAPQPGHTILDLAATLGVDILMLGAPHRRTLATLLKGNVVTEVAAKLPENIQLVIHG